MYTMRFDMRAPDSGTPAPALYGAALEMCAWAETRGAVMAVLSEHHATADGHLPSPLMLASAITARTTVGCASAPRLPRRPQVPSGNGGHAVRRRPDAELHPPRYAQPAGGHLQDQGRPLHHADDVAGGQVLSRIRDRYRPGRAHPGQAARRWQ